MISNGWSKGKNSVNPQIQSGISVLAVGQFAKASLVLLTRCGFPATPCLTVKDALKLLVKGRHQIVLCDLDSPGISNKELFNRVRADFPDVALVVVTRPEKLRDGMLAMVEGASGYIQTPFQPELVASGLRSALTRKRLESAMRVQSLDRIELAKKSV